MQEFIIDLEVTGCWLEEQKSKGLNPFDDLMTIIMEQCDSPEMSILNPTLLRVQTLSMKNSSQIRVAIKEYMTNKYGMSVQNGDYRLDVHVRIIADPGPTVKQQEQAQERSEKTESNPEEQQAVPEVTTETVTMSKEEALKSLQPEQLKTFLEEYDGIIKNARKYGLEEIIWNTSVLLSVDEGYGVTAALDNITDVLKVNGFSFMSRVANCVMEYKISAKHFESDGYWDELLSEVESCYRHEKDQGKRSSTTPLIFYFDISEVMGSINKKALFEKLHRMAKVKGSFLYVFRIPFVEEIAFREVSSVLQDIFMLRTVVIPPYTNRELVEYLKGNLQSKGIHLEKGLDDSFEQLIAQEKKDGRFWGFRTMNRLISDIVYQKLVVSQGEAQLVLTEKDLKRSYEFLTQEEIDPMEKLDYLSGMKDVKQTIEEIVAQIQLYQDMKRSGKKLDAPCMHMRFVGNPGTGKTTVARLVAEIFKSKGILNKGYFYEIKARDLCGRYVGETAPKTSRYCQDALGSVLFIDEAYTLYREGSRVDYGREALDTLITEMENNRDNLVIIMAGYKKEMDELLDANPGLESRMPYTITFRNYTRDELTDIFYKMLSDSFTYTDGFDTAVRDFFQSLSDEVLEGETFSNARMVRNLYERIWSKAAYRRSVSRSEDIILIEDDVKQAVNDEEMQKLLKPQKTKIGF